MLQPPMSPNKKPIHHPTAFYVVQSLSCVQLCNPLDCSTPGFPVLHYLPEFAQTHVHWVGDAIQPSHPLLSSSPFGFNLSQHQGLFQWVGSLHQVAKVLELQLSISSSSEYSGLISFRIDRFDLLAVQGTLKSLLQYHSLKAFFMVQLSHLYMTTGKIIVLIRQTFVSKVMSLLFNMLSQFVIAFLPRCKSLLISWLSIALPKCTYCYVTARGTLSHKCIPLHQSIPK